METLKPGSIKLDFLEKIFRNKLNVTLDISLKDRVEKAAKIIKAMGDGTGAVKVDGKMQDEATVKQANVIIELAKKIRKKDPKLSKSFSKYLT